MTHNGWGYVACPVGSGRFSYPPDKGNLKQDNFLIDQPWGMRCTLCWCLYFSSLSQSVLRWVCAFAKGNFCALALFKIITPNFPSQRSFLMQFSKTEIQSAINSRVNSFVQNLGQGVNFKIVQDFSQGRKFFDSG